MKFIHYNHITTCILILCSIFLISCEEEVKNVDISTLPLEGKEYLKDYERPASLWGFIDEDANIVIPEQYDVVRNFHNGKCTVNEGGLWYFIDLDGKKVSPDTYRGCYNFKNGYARIQNWDGTYNFLNKEYEKALPTDLYFAKNFDDAYAVIQETEGGPIQLLSTDLETSMPFGGFIEGVQIEDVSFITDHYFKIKTLDGLKIYDLNTKKYIGDTYNSIYKGAQDEFIVQDESHISIITADESIKYKDFQSLAYHSDNIYSGIKKDIPVVIKDGQEISLDSLSYITYAEDSMFIYYLEDGLQGLMNYNLEKITDPIYEQIYTYSNSRAAYNRNGLWGFINTDGIELTKPQYGLVWPTHEHRIRVMFRQGVGIVDENFELIIPPGLGELRDLHEGRAAFREQIF